MHLDVESLRTLVAVVELGGMTRAAERLHLSQSAVSWKIKRLEQRVGRPLLVRDGRDLHPTRDGRALLDDARRIVELHDKAVVRLSAPVIAGTVRVGVNEDVDPTSMASLLGRFNRVHPEATVELVVDHTEHLLPAIDKGKFDIVIIQVDDADLRPDDTELWSDELHWVIGRQAGPELTSPEVDGTLPLVTFGEQCFYRAVSEPVLTAAGIDHAIAFSASSIRGVMAAIVAGLGVGVLGGRYLSDEIVEWPGAAALPRLPRVHQIARTVPGDPPAVTAALIETISAELLEVPAAVA